RQPSGEGCIGDAVPGKEASGELNAIGRAVGPVPGKDNFQIAGHHSAGGPGDVGHKGSRMNGRLGNRRCAHRMVSQTPVRPSSKNIAANHEIAEASEPDKGTGEVCSTNV